jgi:antitoxin ParD1/3/4
LYLLQQKQLETYYKEASQEVDPAYENTSLDGLEEDETW